MNHTDDAFKKAAETFPNKAVHLQKDMRMAYNDLGKIYSEQNKNDEALTVLRTAERLDPTEPDAHYHLAGVYAALGQKQQANVEYAKTKQLHEKSAESLIQNISGDKREVVP